MALNKTTAFNGDLYGGLILTEIVTGNEVVQKGSVMVLQKPSSGTKFVVPRLSASVNPLQPYKSSPLTADSKGDLNYTEAVFNLVESMLYMEFNPRDYQFLWEEIRTQGNALNKILNPNIQMRLIEAMLERINEQMGILLWQGDTASLDANLSLFNGLLKRIDADANVIDVTPVAATITSANVISVFEAIIEALPAELYQKEGFKFHISTETHKKYSKAVRDLDFKGTNVFDATLDRFDGVEIVHYAGMPNDRVLYARGLNTTNSNLFMGTELPSDLSSVQVEKLRANSDIWFLRLVFSADTQIGFGKEIVNYIAV